MKINPKHNRKVNEEAKIFRSILIGQTIELMKLIGCEPNSDFTFKRTLIMYQRERNGLMRTVLADKVAYDENKGGNPFLMVESEDGWFMSSCFMSLSNLQIIYEEVYKQVRKY